MGRGNYTEPAMGAVEPSSSRYTALPPPPPMKAPWLCFIHYVHFAFSTPGEVLPSRSPKSAVTLSLFSNSTNKLLLAVLQSCGWAYNITRSLNNLLSICVGTGP
ncbi:hypothetical protein, unlikely [Trypanosoma brucei gambiense DAL972]|uniref:Uncharacterized protein n=1 Tax=Trypanosoma brucei gambiense (strain MHOM/CI/86/DAL972) TaxID=679716 RepID=D0A1S9_TRYB9|nr:hypothetical protein, unlikely [Trypanosoma brucei gambiense DAL972]CBH15222.1 hypothetical protein, unlikely [Trypanosoma brucei gambiense DAL972]|eukprot:XP_011777487.1 hypothetical protein, unlikely [Trypanosoma brucei gambiense DAL972]